jgi:hypothetical protein
MRWATACLLWLQKYSTMNVFNGDAPSYNEKQNSRRVGTYFVH